MDRLTYWDEELGSYLLKGNATDCDAVNALGILEDKNEGKTGDINYKSIAANAVRAFLEGCVLEPGEILDELSLTGDEFFELMGYRLEEEQE